MAISKKTLQRRHPDMIWSVDTLDGRKVVVLMEFQRTVGGPGRFLVREDVHDVRVERLHGRTDPTTGEDHG